MLGEGILGDAGSDILDEPVFSMKEDGTGPRESNVSEEGRDSCDGHGLVFEGVVVKGNQLGRTIGFPTANIRTDTVLPAGVFACRVRVLPTGTEEVSVSAKDGRSLESGKPVYDAMLNVGTRPTVSRSAEVSIEAHLFGFSGDLYGLRLRVELVSRIRSERKFASLEALKAQLAADKSAAQRVLSVKTDL